MDKFSKSSLEAINSLSSIKRTVSEVSDYKNIDFTRFDLEKASVVETGGYIPFGKNLERGEYYLSIASFKKI
ncbi:MAG: hypothetical protein IJX99_08460 [Clostridia bacterium]|nr:hypothetical protein [Clostridia bacterium]